MKGLVQLKKTFAVFFKIDTKTIVLYRKHGDVVLDRRIDVDLRFAPGMAKLNGIYQQFP